MGAIPPIQTAGRSLTAHDNTQQESVGGSQSPQAPAEQPQPVAQSGPQSNVRSNVRSNVQSGGSSAPVLAEAATAPASAPASLPPAPVGAGPGVASALQLEANEPPPERHPIKHQPVDREYDDAQCLQLLSRGEPQGLEGLFVRHGAAILGVLRRYAGGLPPEELEDLRQEVFLTALDIAPRYRGTGSARAWLCGIAVQLGRNQRRRIGWRRRLLGQYQAGPGLGSRLGEGRHPSAAGQIDARRDVERALEALPGPQREVFLLSVVEQLSGPEIAQALDIAEKTVWTRLHRARRAMREALRDTKFDSRAFSPGAREGDPAPGASPSAQPILSRPNDAEDD